MRLIRSISLVVILAGLTVLVVQNMSPSISLVFLGNNSRVLPLSVWLLGAIILGVILACLIQLLLQMSNYLALEAEQPKDRSRQNRKRDVEPVFTPPSFFQKESESPSYKADSPSYSTTQISDYDFPKETKETISNQDKYEKISVADATNFPTPKDKENWGDWLEPKPIRDPNANWEDIDATPRQTVKTAINLGKEEPKNTNVNSVPDKSIGDTKIQTEDTSYSIGYQDPKDSGVGKSESIYDADFRVITPPYIHVPDRPNDEDKDQEEWI